MHDDVSFLLADALAQRAAPLPPAGGEWHLPPLVRDGQLTAATWTSIAKAYLFAELETAGLIVCADAVAESRAQLRASQGFALRIEQHVDLRRYSPTTLEREAFFVRWFGLGRHAAMDDHGNHGFFPRLSDLCGALATLAASGIGAPPRTFADERSRAALDRLAGELALLAGGDLLVVSRIERLASSAVGILAEPELAALLGVSGFAAVVRTLVGGVAVDLAVAYRRGRSGQAVLEDCARLMSRRTGTGTFVEPGDQAITHAVQWLSSYGVGGGAR